MENKIVDIRIEYGIVENGNTYKGGFLPVIYINGERSGNTYGTGYDKTDALAVAHAMAIDENKRWIGDYVTAVIKRSE